MGILDFERSKIGQKTVDSIFIAYGLNSAVYRFLVLESNHIIETKNSEFFENVFSMNESLLFNNQIIKKKTTSSEVKKKQ